MPAGVHASALHLMHMRAGVVGGAAPGRQRLCELQRRPQHQVLGVGDTGGGPGRARAGGRAGGASQAVCTPRAHAQDGGRCPVRVRQPGRPPHCCRTPRLHHPGDHLLCPASHQPRLSAASCSACTDSDTSLPPLSRWKRQQLHTAKSFTRSAGLHFACLTDVILFTDQTCPVLATAGWVPWAQPARNCCA